ncbi:hypothetical protein [Pseudoalteromonas sp. HM-SA03]|uniref:hypothetical protein n=1 Tax=Pseudoalteromonas sp. HM-SA03 TaxID=2029678 RepID=UPI0020D0B6C0|nr:hypothetical protein [Pseudoalteromonas sp. HM-SA03]
MSPSVLRSHIYSQAIAESIAETDATLTFANGPKADQAFNQTLLMRVYIFEGEINNFDNIMDDLKLTKSLGTDTSLTFGYFMSSQSINMSWLWNSSCSKLQEVTQRLSTRLLKMK